MKQSFSRILAAAIGLYLAWGMSRVAADLICAAAEVAALQASCVQVEEEISIWKDERSMSDADLRQWAFQQKGMVSQDDVVFFDGG